WRPGVLAPGRAPAPAAAARRDRAADVGAPDRAATAGLERKHGAVARCHRQHLAVDGGGERELDLADALVLDPLHGDRRGNRLEILRLRPVGAEHRSEERAAAA